MMQLTAVFLKVPEGYVGFVEELSGANTQAATLEEARVNLQEAVIEIVEANRLLAERSIQGQEFIREILTVPLPRRAGLHKGSIEMADDFDAPLDDFADYQ
jgi:predicted RNase H-like HicB family nuclease